jgi:hypothetical protein
MLTAPGGALVTEAEPTGDATLNIYMTVETTVTAPPAEPFPTVTTPAWATGQCT